MFEEDAEEQEQRELQAATLRRRDIVLTHERAYLHRHLLRAASEVAAAVNPLLTGVRDTVALLVERAAVEVAAARDGSRAVTAQTLLDLALPRRGPRPTPASGPGPVLGLGAVLVVDRVAALRRPAPRSHRRPAVAWAAPAALTAVAAGDATLGFTRLVAALLPG